MFKVSFFLVLLCLVPASFLLSSPQSTIGNPDSERQAPLPPEIPWSGASEELIVQSGDPWVTPAEKSGFKISPSYAETLDWLRRLDQASPEIRITIIGKSEEGREIPMVIASRNRSLTAGQARQFRPTPPAGSGWYSFRRDRRQGCRHDAPA